MNVTNHEIKIVKQINVVTKIKGMRDTWITFLSAIGSEGIKLFVITISSMWGTLDRTKRLRDLETLLLLLFSW